MFISQLAILLLSFEKQKKKKNQKFDVFDFRVDDVDANHNQFK